jgi:hypothetical protein
MSGRDLRSLVENFASQLELLIRRELLARVGIALRTGPRSPAGTRTATGAPSVGRRLQGRYIGALRSLKGDNRRRVQMLARTKGVAAALKLADRIRAR